MTVWLLLGCSRLENPPFVEPLPFVDELATELPPSGAVVGSALGQPEEHFLSAWALDDGEVAGLVSTLTEATLFRTTRGAPAATSVLGLGAVGVPLGDELFVADCPMFPRFGLSDPTAGHVELAASGEARCGGSFGPGATPERVLQFDAYERTLRVHAIDRAAGTDTIALAEPPLGIPEGAQILLVHEVAVGAVASVLVVDGALTFVDETGAATTPTGVEGDPSRAEAWVGADGAVRVATSAALYRWDGATLERLDEVPDSPIDAAWTEGGWRGGAWAEAGEPNPGDPTVTVPTAMAVRYATDDAFRVFQPPLTPCCDEAACRSLGESYLVGGFGGADGDVALYDVWSWVLEGADLTSATVVRPLVDACDG